MLNLSNVGLPRNRKALPKFSQHEFNLPLFDWAASKSLLSQTTSSLPVRKLQAKYGLSPSLASLIAYHAGYKTHSMELTHG
jgi:hypothetical protein